MQNVGDTKYKTKIKINIREKQKAKADHKQDSLDIASDIGSERNWKQCHAVPDPLTIFGR